MAKIKIEKLLEIDWEMGVWKSLGYFQSSFDFWKDREKVRMVRFFTEKICLKDGSWKMKKTRGIEEKDFEKKMSFYHQTCRVSAPIGVIVENIDVAPKFWKFLKNLSLLWK